MGDRRVVLRLKALDQLGDLRGLRDLPVDEHVGPVGCLAQFERGQVESGDLGERVDQRERRGGVGGLGQVVRHLDDQPDGVPARLAEAVLHERRRGRGHLQLRGQRHLRGDEPRAGGVRDDAEGPGVRNAHGHAEVRDHRTGAESLGE